MFPDFPLAWTGFFQGKLRNQFLGIKKQEILMFFFAHSEISIEFFDDEQVYLELQVTNFKIYKNT